MRVFVIGHRGMLGHVVARYLAEQGMEVATTEARYAADPRDPLVEAVRDSGCEWVVNALGRIKHKSQSSDELYRANSLFPIHLAARLKPNQRLVHASTDCVFSGRQGAYLVNAERDAEDVYGFSKLLAEVVACPNTRYIIRTSIIGPELGTGYGLMGWFLKQTGPVKGYKNHLWNGLTTLEWAKVCHEIMDGTLRPAGPLVQPGVWPPVSKAELLSMLGRIWNHPITIDPMEAAEAVDRSLKPEVVRPPLEQQLGELRKWYW